MREEKAVTALDSLSLGRGHVFVTVLGPLPSLQRVPEFGSPGCWKHGHTQTQ